MREIDEERYALKALRGDFGPLNQGRTIVTPVPVTPFRQPGCEPIRQAAGVQAGWGPNIYATKACPGLRRLKNLLGRGYSGACPFWFPE